MNKKFVLFHLEEAKEELDRLIEELKADKEELLYPEVQHLYHHINTAWNGRDNPKGIDTTQDEFDTWRQFPNDVGLEYRMRRDGFIQE